MTRRQKVTRARALRREGMLLREIAVEMGLGRSTVWALLDDPDRAKEIARKNSYAPTCGCGKKLNGAAGRGSNAPKRCCQCQGEVTRERLRPEREMAAECVVLMWADGKTRTEIAEAMGWTPGTASVRITQLRNLGYDLPYRREDSVKWARKLYLTKVAA